MPPGLISVRIDDRDMQKGFDRMQTAAQQTRTFYAAMRMPVKADIREHGKQEEGPDGPWPARDPEYLAGRTLQGRRGKRLKRRRRRAPRQMLGKLTKSIRMRVQSDALVISSPVSWGGAHQEGGVVGRGAVLPERPFLYLSDDLVELAGKVYAAFVKNSFPKGVRAKVTT